MNPSILYLVLIVIASSSYGILSTIVKLAIQAGYSSAEAITSQYLFGFVLAFLLFIATQRSLPHLSAKSWRTLLLSGIFTASTGIVYGHSLNFLPASLAVVMLFQFTWIGLLLDCALKRRRPTRTESISLAFLFAGTICAAGLFDVDLSTVAWQGWVFGLLSAVSFAIFIQINTRPIEGITTIARTFFISVIALVVISTILTPEIIWNGQLMNGLWQYGLALGVFGIILPILLFSIAGPKVGGALSSILSAMELPVAILASMFVLGELLTTLQLLGIALVLIGMVLPPYLTIRTGK